MRRGTLIRIHGFLIISEDGTFLVRPKSPKSLQSIISPFCIQLTDWLAHVPKEVIAKNFQLDISDFNSLPGEELYIFPAGANTYSSVGDFY